MIIILSAQYVGQDLRSEFGKIPPTFLPVGNKRLYTYQVNNVRNESSDEKIVMTLPKSFEIEEWDSRELEDMNVEVIFVDEGFSLGQSIVFCLACCCHSEDDSVIIYYGDTLLSNAVNLNNIGKDVMYTAHSDFNYEWMKVDNQAEPGESVFCGVLSIAKPQLFIRNMISANFDFDKGIEKYNITNHFLQECRVDWLDFGHLNTFYDSKTIVTTARVFNDLRINKYYVEKQSKEKTKLNGEAYWFSHIPEEMAYYVPMMISHHEEEESYRYKLEYLYNPTLTELFVYGNHPEDVWSKIIDSCFNFIENSYRIKNPEKCPDFYQSLVAKNKKRLNDFLISTPRFSQVIQDKEGDRFILKDILNELHRNITPTSDSSFMHGDFCFSNILYDFKKNDVKVIDPRGTDFGGNPTIYGDARYDLAKLLHSAVGKYDYIVSDRFRVTDDGKTLNMEMPRSRVDLAALVKKKFLVSRFSYKEIMALTATLFLSMLPLHYDKPERQRAFVAIAIELYKEFKK